jgi:energy-coupling factor transporter ATP-binding protein EcfA2
MSMVETKSHRAASETLLAMGRLFYSGAQVLPSVKLRLQPLLIGPTGAGKSALVEHIARKLGADYMKLTRGDWIVTGGRGGRSTMYQIIDRVLGEDRLLVHLDELDKFTDLRGGDWSAAIGADLWNLLDGKFQIQGYLAETTFPDATKPTVLAVRMHIRAKLWIVGSGTWQEVFERARSGSTMGFQGSRKAEMVDLGVIARSGIIGAELLHRFHGDPIFVEYPTREETAEILESSGIARLARKAGRPINPDDIDWTKGGMRLLETIATRLFLECQRRSLPKQEMLPFPDDTASPED